MNQGGFSPSPKIHISHAFQRVNSRSHLFLLCHLLALPRSFLMSKECIQTLMWTAPDLSRRFSARWITLVLRPEKVAIWLMLKPAFLSFAQDAFSLFMKGILIRAVRPPTDRAIFAADPLIKQPAIRAFGIFPLFAFMNAVLHEFI